MKTWTPRDCQVEGVQWCLDRPAAYLMHPMGAGKTSTVLTVIDRLLWDYLDVTGVIVVAPAMVVETETWSRQARAWKHLDGLEVVEVKGDAKTRLRAATQAADVHVISRENLVWLAKSVPWKWQMLVWDEADGLKNRDTVRFSLVRQLRPKLKRVIEMSGTPAPNGLPDLWAPMWVLDFGERLGRTITAFRERWCVPDKRDKKQVFSYKVRDEAASQEIYDLISDICHRADVDLGVRVIDNDVPVQLSKQAMAKYRELERDMLLEIDEYEIVALSASGLTQKLQQLAQGAVYDQERVAVHLHDEKLDALEQVIEQAGGQPVLVAYWFKHDLVRLRQRFPHGVEFKGGAEFDAWQRGQVPLMFIHPASAAHGVDGLQHGGSIVVLFALTWSRALYEQLIARLARPGQQKTVIVQCLRCVGTVDDDITDAVEWKGDQGVRLAEALIERRRRYINDDRGADSGTGARRRAAHATG
jgi:hypothetical protein